MTDAHAGRRRLCLLPKVHGVGGMVSFREKLTRGLRARGFAVCDDLRDEPYDAVLVIGGTRQIAGLLRVRRRGMPVIQRLNGMNWIHRKRPLGLRHALRAELANALLSTIRNRAATHVVYQSRFAKAWWERVYGATRVGSSVVLNGVDLDRYSPQGAGRPPDHTRLLVVEGNIGGGYEIGLDHALDMAAEVQTRTGAPVELTIVGKIEDGLRAEIEARAAIRIDWRGLLPPESIPELDRSAHLLYASDLHPACPNTVIEALACGLPVLGFDTGALSELVREGAGEVVPYGGDAWNLDEPDIQGLAAAAVRILQRQADYRRAARTRAEKALGLDAMVEGYLAALGWS